MSMRIDSSHPFRGGIARKTVSGKTLFLDFHYLVGNSEYQIKVYPTWVVDQFQNSEGMPIEVHKLPPIGSR